MVMYDGMRAVRSGLGLGLHEEPGGSVRGGPAGLIEVLDTEASWGAAGSL